MAGSFNKEDISNNLLELFSKFKHGDVVVSEASHITSELGIDSLSVMEIVAELEDAYDLTFADEDLPTVRTVGDVQKLIEHHLRELGRLA
jgi:acyl carrier protein